ncbi:MAG: hypothetical protein RIN56_03160 [Sporomusaceae bacterium]|nr:hypothetical protein [Sporomusaceae bacterium]
MDNFLYGRKYRVLVADKNNNALDVSNLRCTFRVEKVALQVANHAEVSIYNLSPDTEKVIIKEGMRVILEAGYQGYLKTQQQGAAQQVLAPKQYGKIFDGEVIQAIRDREDVVDYKLTLVCLDGDSFLNNNIVKMTVNAGLNQRQIVDQIATKAVTPTEIGRISPDLKTQNLPRGKVFFGMPKDYLRDIARDNNANFWVEDGQVYIAKATDTPPGEALVLTPKTGLVGVPQQTFDGVTFKCLLNPAIKLMTMVQIDNSLIRMQKKRLGQIPVPLDDDGQYQAYKVIHYGDTRGNEWYTEVDGVSRYGAAAPLMLANKIQSPNG